MKIRLSKEILVKALGWVQSVVEKKSTMPVLSHALFRAYKNNLEIAATNLQMVVEGHVEADVLEEGAITLNAKRMNDIVRTFPSGMVEITTDEKNRAEVKGEKGVFHVLGLSETEYPPLPEYKDVAFVEIKADTMKAMIDRTIFAASLEESRYNLEGIFLQVTGDGKKLRMVATDGHRLCLVDREAENADKLNIGNGVTLPRKGLGELKKILGEGLGIESIGFGIVGNDVIFKAGPVVIMMRTLEGEYPNYDRVIPQGNNKKLVVNRARLLETLSRVSVISEEKTRGIKFIAMPGKLVIESQNPEIGDATEEVEAVTDIDKIEIGYNVKYLLEALGAMESENLAVMLKDGLSSALFLPEGEPEYTCVIMPMRL